MSKCLKCEKEHDGSFGSGKYCSRQCANSRKITGEIKVVSCKQCNRKVIVGKRANPKIVLCELCREKEERCKQCGAIKGQCKRLDICKKVQIFPTLIKYFGFDERVIGTEKLYEEFERIHNLLYEDYIVNELSTLELQEKYNCLNQRIINSLRSLSIDRRSCSHAVSLAIFKGKVQVNTMSYSRYITCHHTTWNNKEVFLRSSYELDYAKELDSKQVDYEVEKLRILYWDSQLCRQRVAIPDFYLTETNTIVEIKSDWTLDKQEMKDKFKAYRQHGYKVKLILEHKEVEF